MNCKHGDMAVIVRGPHPEHYGKTFECVELIPENTKLFGVDKTGALMSAETINPCWVVPFPLPEGLGVMAEIYLARHACPDKWCMPIPKEQLPTNTKKDEVING